MYDRAFIGQLVRGANLARLNFPDILLKTLLVSSRLFSSFATNCPSDIGPNTQLKPPRSLCSAAQSRNHQTHKRTLSLMPFPLCINNGGRERQ
uniref:Uncharacterized protein n=1 Tax=Manihot esculenta TaxID=3983 RepID=A0A2C9UGA2_MANES